VSRVLMLMPSLPGGLDSGARLRNHGLLRLLAQDHDVDVLTFDVGERRGLDAFAADLHVVTLPRGRSAARRLLDVGRSRLPDMALRLRSVELTRRVECLIQEREYAAVQAEGIEMGGYLGLVPPELRVYDAHNAEFLLQQRLSNLAPSMAGRLYSRVQWQRLERFERDLVRGSRMTLAVSEHDANQLLALSGSETSVRVVPNAIDVHGYAYREPSVDQAPNVLFVGKLDFRPNAEALRWFVSEVLGGVPEMRLFAVGDAPPAWLVHAGQHNDRIAVTGYVADERTYFNRSLALALPVATGGGSRLKALIAMASGLPIVSTRVGMEGLEAEAGRHFLQADSVAEFVAALRDLVTDVGLRVRLARAGRALVEERYDWSAVQADVRAAYAWLVG
jgi:glycosyltransferase involved in cell wall biosynthesis